jgi:hypothetical protein
VARTFAAFTVPKDIDVHDTHCSQIRNDVRNVAHETPVLIQTADLPQFLYQVVEGKYYHGKLDVFVKCAARAVKTIVILCKGHD